MTLRSPKKLFLEGTVKPVLDLIVGTSLKIASDRAPLVSNLLLHFQDFEVLLGSPLLIPLDFRAQLVHPSFPSLLTSSA